MIMHYYMLYGEETTSVEQKTDELSNSNIDHIFATSGKSDQNRAGDSNEKKHEHQDNLLIGEKDNEYINPPERIDKLESNKKDTKTHAVRLETIDMDATDNKSISAEMVHNLEGTNKNGSIGELNATVNDTAHVNITSKSFPKRVKCLKRFKHPHVNNDGEHADDNVENKLHVNKDVDIDTNTIKSAVEPVVEILNGTTFLRLLSEKHNPNITNRSTPGECSLVIFYAPWCPFSAMAAPSFNGLARLYPDVALYAVDSSKYQSINTQFGILAYPTLMMFHNTKPISKFNQSTYMVENFSEFVNIFTGLQPALTVELLDQDMQGPMPTKAVPEPDYYLYLAWLFTVACALGYFGKSSYCEWIIESFRNNWREAEIQHEHID